MHFSANLTRQEMDVSQWEVRDRRSHISLSSVSLEEYEQVFLSTSPSAAESLCQAKPSAKGSDL